MSFEFTAGEVPSGSTPDRPDNPNVGDLYYDLQINGLLYWNGLTWEQVSTSAEGGYVRLDPKGANQKILGDGNFEVDGSIIGNKKAGFLDGIDVAGKVSVVGEMDVSQNLAITNGNLIVQNGSAAAPSTQDGDLGNTLTTKDYVDGKVTELDDKIDAGDGKYVALDNGGEDQEIAGTGSFVLNGVLICNDVGNFSEGAVARSTVDDDIDAELTTKELCRPARRRGAGADSHKHQRPEQRRRFITPGGAPVQPGDIPTNTSDLTNDSGFITDAGVTKIVAGTNVTIDPADGTGEVTINSTGGGGGGFSGDYNDLTNKPDIPENTSELTNDSGFITAADIPAIPENTSDLTNDSGFITAADLPTVGDGTITVRQGGTEKGVFTVNQGGDLEIDLDAGGGGGVAQDLSYSSGGAEGPGTIEITSGNDADIPVVTDSQAGLMRASQKQQLDSIINDGGGFGGDYNDLTNQPTIGDGQIPIKQEGTTKGSFTVNQTGNVEIDLDGGGGGFSGDYNDLTNKPFIPTDTSDLSNGAGFITSSDINISGSAPIQASGTNVGLNFNRGLTLVGNDLEVALGARMTFDGSGAIASDAPPDSVSGFAPITLVNSGDLALPTQRNFQGAPGNWTGSFTIPDGATKFSIVSRVRCNLLCTTDSLIDAAAGPVSIPTMWCDAIGYTLNFDGGVNEPGTGNAYAVSQIKNLALPMKANRAVGGFAVRMNVFNVPGTGNRTIN